MALRRLAGDCKIDDTCPGLWEDDEYPGEVIVVGWVHEHSRVPVGHGEKAVRLSKQIVRDAGLGA